MLIDYEIDGSSMNLKRAKLMIVGHSGWCISAEIRDFFVLFYHAGVQALSSLGPVLSTLHETN